MYGNTPDQSRDYEPDSLRAFSFMQGSCSTRGWAMDLGRKFFSQNHARSRARRERAAGATEVAGKIADGLKGLKNIKSSGCKPQGRNSGQAGNSVGRNRSRVPRRNSTGSASHAPQWQGSVIFGWERGRLMPKDQLLTRVHTTQLGRVHGPTSGAAGGRAIDGCAQLIDGQAPDMRGLYNQAGKMIPARADEPTRHFGQLQCRSRVFFLSSSDSSDSVSILLAAFRGLPGNPVRAYSRGKRSKLESRAAVLVKMIEQFNQNRNIWARNVF
ncbi:hypothetical protein FB451DRAFT_1188747 [Mycena latifolia]|nr:hypothetical protein FB451DRAFT_1188747 [Mycena latifolia]